MNPFTLLEGWRSYIAAAGFFGKALYDFSQNDFASAYASLMAALAVFGVKSAIAKQVVEQKAMMMKLSEKL